MTRGIIGHEALEAFYKSIQQEYSYDESAQAALDVVEGEQIKAVLAEDFDKVEMLISLRVLIQKYCEYYESDIQNWEVLGVETFYAMEWEGEHEVYLPMRMDLVIYQRAGKFKGEISPVDHKFTNDFWKQWKVRLNSQLPLYNRTLRKVKFKGKQYPIVKRSILNMIRTREVKDPQPHDTFKREFIEAQPATMVLAFENHLKVAKRISRLKRMPAAEAFEETTAAWSSPNCQFCSFKSLCAIQYEGGNIRNTIAAEYVESSYGYPALEELKSER